MQELEVSPGGAAAGGGTRRLLLPTYRQQDDIKKFLKVEFSLWRRVYISTQVDMGSILERDSFYALHVLHVLSSRFSL